MAVADDSQWNQGQTPELETFYTSKEGIDWNSEESGPEDEEIFEEDRVDASVLFQCIPR